MPALVQGSEMTTIGERADIQGLLAQMRAMKGQVETLRPGAEPPRAEALPAAPPTSTSFGEVLGQAVGHVNNLQQTSQALAHDYERGEPGVSLEQVMIAGQKAEVSFQALTQVRNRLVEAYQEIMNMPV